MTNYDEAKTLLGEIPSRSLYKEGKLEKAQVLATLALADAMNAGRAQVAELNEVHLIHAYDPDTDMLVSVVSAHRDRIKAYEVRDQMNAKANEIEATVRYIVKTVGLA